MDNLFNVYVVWCLDGPTMVTLLQYTDDDMQRQCMQVWSVQNYIEQAFDCEYPGENNLIVEGMSYECVAIFEAVGKNELRFIY